MYLVQDLAPYCSPELTRGVFFPSDWEVQILLPFSSSLELVIRTWLQIRMSCEPWEASDFRVQGRGWEPRRAGDLGWIGGTASMAWR